MLLTPDEIRRTKVQTSHQPWKGWMGQHNYPRKCKSPKGLMLSLLMIHSSSLKLKSFGLAATFEALLFTLRRTLLRSIRSKPASCLISYSYVHIQNIAEAKWTFNPVGVVPITRFIGPRVSLAVIKIKALRAFCHLPGVVVQHSCTKPKGLKCY